MESENAESKGLIQTVSFVVRRLNTIEIAIGVDIDCDTDSDLDKLVVFESLNP